MTYVVGHFLGGGPKKDAIDFVPALAFDAAFSLLEDNGSLVFCGGSTFLPLRYQFFTQEPSQNISRV